MRSFTIVPYYSKWSKSAILCPIMHKQAVQSQHLGPFLRNLRKYNLECDNITGCKNSIHNKHGAATRAILYLEAASPGKHSFMGSMRVWMKDMFENRDWVGMFYYKNISNAWLSLQSQHLGPFLRKYLENIRGGYHGYKWRCTSWVRHLIYFCSKTYPRNLCSQTCLVFHNLTLFIPHAACN
jgi:hypothetical protein